MNWEKLTIPIGATFKSTNFPSFYELEKLRSTAYVQESKVPVLNILMNWEKLSLNLNFIAENKMGIYTRLATFQP